MKIQNTTVINNIVVHKIESHRGILIYQDDDDIMYVCKGGDVVYTLDVDPFSGEGGGGSISIVKIDK